MPDEPQAQPAPGQDPQVTPDPTPAAPAAPTPAPQGNAPWQNDLAALFPDEAVRGQVDQYVRSTIQPRMTQLEQQVAQNADAQRLWQELNENPLDAYVQITTEMFGEEAGEALMQSVQTALEAQQTPEGYAPQQQQGQPYDPRLQAALDYIESQQTATLYDQEMARVKGEYTARGEDLDEDLFAPFVAAAQGDFNQANQLYTTWLQNFNAKNGTPPAEEPPAAQVLGSDTEGATSSATPTQQKETLDEAITNWVSEQASTAPPVGTV